MKAGHQIEVDAFPDADFVELESAEQVLGDVGEFIGVAGNGHNSLNIY